MWCSWSYIFWESKDLKNKWWFYMGWKAVRHMGLYKLPCYTSESPSWPAFQLGAEVAQDDWVTPMPMHMITLLDRLRSHEQTPSGTDCNSVMAEGSRIRLFHPHSRQSPRLSFTLVSAENLSHWPSHNAGFHLEPKEYPVKFLAYSIHSCLGYYGLLISNIHTVPP